VSRIRRVPILVGVACAVGIAVTGCSGSRVAEHPTTSRPPPRTEAVSLPAARLDCRDPIATLDRPDRGMRVVGDAVALVTSRSRSTVLRTAPSGERDPAFRRFAKTGLLVRTGTRSELVVPSSWRGREAFRWGNTGGIAPTGHLVIECPGDGRWVAFPGGHLVPTPACVAIVVATAARVRTVRVPVGRRCPTTRANPR
jgi:hypothetical protein